MAGPGQGVQLLIGCHHVAVKVYLLLFAFAIGGYGWKVAGAVEVDVSIDVLAVQPCKIGDVLLQDVRVPVDFTDNRAVFTLYQAIVVTVPGA